MTVGQIPAAQFYNLRSLIRLKFLQVHIMRWLLKVSAISMFMFFMLFSVFISGCSVKIEPLMPTPVLYESTQYGPLDNIPLEEQWNLRRVYYATTRARDSDLQKINYTNTESDQVSVGMALIGFGSENMTWDDLSEASRQVNREDVVPLSIAGILEAGKYRFDTDGNITDVSGAAKWLMANLDESIESSRDKDILIYVHGAKVNFYNASVFAAQLDHFMGRDMTSIAFSWPTRQNIFAYVLGDDKARSYSSAPALESLITVLAKKTEARRIHVITWSAGGRLVTAALAQLRMRHPTDSAEQLSDRYRLGTVYYAAADVPRDEFIAALPAIDDLVQRIVVTGSSNDDALKSAKMVMGGDTRLGQIGGTLTEEQREAVLQADRLEYIDLSRGRERRGFDITGHRYWFNHPWASSDLVLAIRTDLDPQERGLEQGEVPLLWWMPDDYPERLKSISAIPAQKFRK
jgi:esterase/lipase superfamily enzyme